MLIATHSLVGAFAGKEIGYPPVAFLLGIISHIILDSIPHADGPDDSPDRKESDPHTVGQYLLVAVDIALAIAIFMYFSQDDLLNSSMLWGAAGGIFPDFIDNVPFWSPSLRKWSPIKKFHEFHVKIQSIKLPVVFGLALQYFISVVFFLLIVLLYYN